MPAPIRTYPQVITRTMTTSHGYDPQVPDAWTTAVPPHGGCDEGPSGCSGGFHYYSQDPDGFFYSNDGSDHEELVQSLVTRCTSCQKLRPARECGKFWQEDSDGEYVQGPGGHWRGLCGTCAARPPSEASVSDDKGKNKQVKTGKPKQSKAKMKPMKPTKKVKAKRTQSNTKKKPAGKASKPNQSNTCKSKKRKITSMKSMRNKKDTGKGKQADRRK